MHIFRHFNMIFLKFDLLLLLLVILMILMSSLLIRDIVLLLINRLLINRFPVRRLYLLLDNELCHLMVRVFAIQLGKLITEVFTSH